MIFKVPLKDLVLSQKGMKPAILKKEPFQGSVPYLDISVLETGEVKEFTHSNLGNISTDKDVLVVWDGSRNGLALKGQNGAIGSTLMALTPIKLDSDYLLYFLKSKFDFINGNSVGTGIPHVNSDLFFDLEVPYVNLEEQKKIVNTLNSKLFENRDLILQQKNLIKTVLQNSNIEFQDDDDVLKTIQNFRKAIIDSAILGQLTKEWRNSQNFLFDSGEYFNEIKAEIEASYSIQRDKSEKMGLRRPRNSKDTKKSEKENTVFADIPENWSLVRLEDITHLVTDGTHHKPKYQKEGVPFLSVKNVRPFKINDNDIKYISESEHQLINKRCNPEEGDILYTKIGATFGYAASVRLKYSFSIFVSLALIKPVKKYIDSEYLEILMNSEFIFNQARQRITGVANPDLHLIEIRDFRIPLTHIDEQKEIVHRVMPLIRIADELQKQYEQSLIDFTSLEKSILQEVFSLESLSQSNLIDKEILEQIASTKKTLEVQRVAFKKKQQIFKKDYFMQNNPKNVIEEIKRLSIKHFLNVDISQDDKKQIFHYLEDSISDIDFDDYSTAFQQLAQEKIEDNEEDSFFVSFIKDGTLYHKINPKYETSIP